MWGSSLVKQVYKGSAHAQSGCAFETPNSLCKKPTWVDTFHSSQKHFQGRVFHSHSQQLKNISLHVDICRGLARLVLPWSTLFLAKNKRQALQPVWLFLAPRKRFSSITGHCPEWNVCAELVCSCLLAAREYYIPDSELGNGPSACFYPQDASTGGSGWIQNFWWVILFPINRISNWASRLALQRQECNFHRTLN